METEAFVIEKGVPKIGSRGPRTVKLPEFYRMQTTMKQMERGDSFVFPLNGFKIWSVKGWVKKINKGMNDNILDPSVRAKNPIAFSCLPIKTATGELTGCRIYRDF